MNLRPIYRPENTQPVHNLRFDWTGWFKGDPPQRENIKTAIEHCRDAWRKDGIEPETFSIEDAKIQIMARTGVQVAPVSFTQRIKGRLMHACRQSEMHVPFRRKVSFRTLGDNTRETVENYIDRQADKSDYVDPRFKRLLGNFTLTDKNIHLSEASQTTHGHYWYNIHLVIVIEDRRFPITKKENLSRLPGACMAIARKKGYAVSHLSVMPDHLHLAVRGAVDQSPEEIALAFLNNLSYVLGYNRCWSWEYYVGTFSEYTLRALRGEDI